MLGVFSQVKALTRQLRLLTALNLELARLEGKEKATAVGLAGGLAVGALHSSSTQSASPSRPPQRGWRRPFPSGFRYSSSQVRSSSSLASLGSWQRGSRARPRRPSRLRRSRRRSGLSRRCAEMAERSTDEIRQKMAVERTPRRGARRLQAELRSLVPVAAVALAVVGIVTARVGFRAGIGMVRRLS